MLVTVEMDVLFEWVSECTLLVSELTGIEVLWFDMGNASAFSTLTSMLAWALGGALPKPRSAKLIERDIRGVRSVAEVFGAGLLGVILLTVLGPFGVDKGRSALLGIVRVEYPWLLGPVSCSLNRDIDLADIRSCMPENWTSGSLGRFDFVVLRGWRRFGNGLKAASSYWSIHDVADCCFVGLENITPFVFAMSSRKGSVRRLSLNRTW